MADGEPNTTGPDEDQGQRRLHLRGVTEVTSGGSDLPVYDGVGTELKSVREEIGSTRAEFASQLRIREPYLGAIEDGRFDDLPGPVYAVGFIRSYADAVGLDGEEFVERFKRESAAGPDQTRLRFPAPEVESRLPSGRLLVLSLFFVGAVYAGWYYLSDVDRTVVEQVPAVPGRLLASDQDGKPVADDSGTATNASTLNTVESDTGLSRANAAPASTTFVGTAIAVAVGEGQPTDPGSRIVSNTETPAIQAGSAELASTTTPTSSSTPGETPPVTQAPAVLQMTTSSAEPRPAPAMAAEPSVGDQPISPTALATSASVGGHKEPVASAARASVAEQPASATEENDDSTAATPVAETTDVVRAGTVEETAPPRDLRQRPGRNRDGEQAQEVTADVNPPVSSRATQLATADIDIEQPTANPQTELAALSVPEPPTANANEPRYDDATAAPRLYGNDNGESRVTLTARLDSWVQVVSENNELLLTRILRAGDTYFVPNQPGLLLLTGNAGALEVSVDGRPLPPIGPIGAVRRNVSLDPENLLNTARQSEQ